MEPNPPLAQKCFWEITVVEHHDFDTHCADRKGYLCRSHQNGNI